MSDLISAVQAHKLANPDYQEGLARYKTNIAEAVTDAAFGQVERISLRVPEMYQDELICYIKEYGYEVSIQQEAPVDIPGWAFLYVSWANIVETE